MLNNAIAAVLGGFCIVVVIFVAGWCMCKLCEFVAWVLDDSLPRFFLFFGGLFAVVIFLGMTYGR